MCIWRKHISHDVTVTNCRVALEAAFFKMPLGSGHLSLSADMEMVLLWQQVWVKVIWRNLVLLKINWGNLMKEWWPTHHTKPEMRHRRVSSSAATFSIVLRSLTIPCGHATIYSPHFLKLEMKWKEAKAGKRWKRVFGLISLAKGYAVTLSLHHNLTEASSCECVCLSCKRECTYVHVCIRVCVSGGAFSRSWLVCVLTAFAVALRIKGVVFTYTHVHLQVSLRLPASLPPCRRCTLFQQPLSSPTTCSF